MRRFLTPRNGSASAFSPVLEKKKRDKEEKPHRSVSSSFREVSLSRQGERGTLPFPPLIDGTNRMWEQDGWVFSKVDDDDNGDEEDGFSITRETTHTNRGL